MTEVITVTHDAHRFVELCVKAVHRFTKQPYQHIIIDNGSQPETLNFLHEKAREKWITLHTRQVSKTATGHATALNWYLQSHRPELVCLLDSDAYPIIDDWLGILLSQMNANKADAIGCSHFRDETLLHPSTMLFKYSAYILAGKPSFLINKSFSFMDTGMVVCKKMRETGAKLIPLDRLTKMREVVKHRWRATRFENARGNMIDDVPKEIYKKETEEWFNDSLVKEILITQ